MIPLIKAMDRPCPVDELQVSIVNQSEINAGNAGGCQFLVTAGLLQRANDDQLRGVLAHEIAHQDLGHVARQQVLNTGLGIGTALLERIFPGSGAIAPLAGTLIARGHGRTEEYAADRHGVDILRRAGHPAEIMADTLTWLRSVSGAGGGGFLSTHPALDERIAELRKLR
jgi:predicted Zn-dependent protease